MAAMNRIQTRNFPELAVTLVRRILQIFSMIFLPLLAGAAYADDHRTEWPERYDCVNDIPNLMAEAVAPVHTLEFCPEFLDGVAFSFFGFQWLSDNVGPRLLGSPSGLFGFRQSGFSHKSNNRLDLILVPRSNTVHLWDVNFRSASGEVSQSDGATEWIVWSEYQVPRAGSRLLLPADDTVARLIDCVDPFGCGTRYVVPVCDDYQFPWLNRASKNRPHRVAAPLINVTMRDYDRSQEIIASFAEVNNLVKLAMQVTLRMSCR